MLKKSKCPRIEQFGTLNHCNLYYLGKTDSGRPKLKFQFYRSYDKKVQAEVVLVQGDTMELVNHLEFGGSKVQGNVDVLTTFNFQDADLSS